MIVICTLWWIIFSIYENTEEKIFHVLLAKKRSICKIFFVGVCVNLGVTAPYYCKPLLYWRKLPNQWNWYPMELNRQKPHHHNFNRSGGKGSMSWHSPLYLMCFRYLLMKHWLEKQQSCRIIEIIYVSSISKDPFVLFYPILRKSSLTWYHDWIGD
jgi:hypothetical protein